MTPMMLQYLEIKKQYPDAFLFYRLGDFYEMFFDDAKAASKILELTLTGRDCGEAERAPMCGVPYHAADTYISRLVSKGHKVVICEQMEDPATAKGLVKRDITRIITPGTVTDNVMLDDRQNNYLCAICINNSEAGISFADASTGDVYATEVKGSFLYERIITEIEAYSPREVLINLPLSECPALRDYLRNRLKAVVNDGNDTEFEYTRAALTVKRQFGKNMGGAAEHESPVITCCIGALLAYIANTHKTDVSYIRNLSIYTDGQFLEIDPNTRRNLEICETMRTKEKKGSLLWVLDRTKTSMGARLLRKWLELPLVNTHYITRRQDAVGEFKDGYMLREEIAQSLRSVLDAERLMAKIIYGTANARDLRAISETLSVIKPIKELLRDVVCEELISLRDRLDPLEALIGEISGSIVELPPTTIREGGMIADGIDAELDRLRGLLKNSKAYLEELIEEERAVTGIAKLKYGYNRVFGYYIEITNANKGELPDYYIRKQTLAGAERYITPKLKELESAILGASEKICALEYEIFCRLRDRVAEYTVQIQNNASLLATLDVYVSLGEVASRNNFVRPEVAYDDSIVIKDGRHPVVEQFVFDSYFVPNDTNLDTSHNRLMLITGPNMAGKSTYMRQVALITLMAQAGSFVPASDAHIGIVDKLFTRVGASDDLASGQSTFMLEMNEVAYILKNATKRSLIIYDEIGRGTSTFDGMSIARAVAEYTASKRLGAKTLFATHYHELTSLEDELEGIVNYNIAAKKKGDDIIFLRKIIRGNADDSYGIEVAKLAGVPNEVIKRAKEILSLTESGEITAHKPTSEPTLGGNVSFEDMANAEIADKIRSCDINTLTPIEAINLIFELKKLT